MSGRNRRVAGGRYDERLIAARIKQRRRQVGTPVKDLVERVGMNQSDYSRKSRCLTAFSLLDYERLADALEAPIGWPFVDEWIGEALESVKEGKPRDA